MNKFIKEQLLKCRVELPQWDDDTTQLIIPIRSNTIVNNTYIDESKIQVIKIKDYIINEPANFTLSSNWNGGTKPPEHLMKVKILEHRGKMLKVSGTGLTTNKHWDGWLPQKGFEYEGEDYGQFSYKI